MNIQNNIKQANNNKLEIKFYKIHQQTKTNKEIKTKIINNQNYSKNMMLKFKNKKEFLKKIKNKIKKMYLKHQRKNHF